MITEVKRSATVANYVLELTGLKNLRVPFSEHGFFKLNHLTLSQATSVILRIQDRKSVV